jgi:GT2 family glycosyltransferase
MLDSLPPRLSIVIPTRDRVSELRMCLAAIHAARIERMECIVVDDGSIEDLTAVVQAANLDTTLLRNSEPMGSGAARNMGAAAARGEVLLFVDDDVLVARNSLHAVCEAFACDASLGAVIGRYDDSPASPGTLSRFRNLLHAYTHHVSAGPAVTFWTGFGAVRSTVFRAHGGFIEQKRAIDDVEFGSRLTAAGVRIELRSELQVKHLKRWTLHSMVKTDLLLRGIPWTLLVWRGRKLPNTLNLRRSSRFSVAAAPLALLACCAAGFHRLSWIAPAVCVAAAMVINLKFYAFLKRRGGRRFALASIGLHWIYLCTAAVSFVAGTAIFVAQQLRKVRMQPAAEQPGAEESIAPLAGAN